MIIGITGTQQGTTAKALLELVLYLNDATEMHHGDCIGADAQAHDVCLKHAPHVRITVHPPEIAAKRAYKRGDEVRPALPYLARNREIVRACDRLLAFPSGPEKLRSGTWSTVRYAVRVGKPVTVIYPDGSKEER